VLEAWDAYGIRRHLFSSFRIFLRKYFSQVTRHGPTLHHYLPLILSESDWNVLSWYHQFAQKMWHVLWRSDTMVYFNKSIPINKMLMRFRICVCLYLRLMFHLLISKHSLTTTFVQNVVFLSCSWINSQFTEILPVKSTILYSVTFVVPSLFPLTYC
jgi:hypothetical protein